MKSDRFVNGYRLIYKPDHFNCMKSANWKGYVYEHRYVMEVNLGRCLNNNEEFHHLDCNKLNNLLTNLIVLTKNDHQRIHAWIDSGANINESYIRNGLNSKKSKVIEPKYCPVCRITVQTFRKMLQISNN